MKRVSFCQNSTCYGLLLHCLNADLEDIITNSVLSGKLVPGGHPACIGDQAYIKSPSLY